MIALLLAHDSIKARVKARGGAVDGDFRASLSWHNSDDLDLHLREPNGFEIYYGATQSPTGQSSWNTRTASRSTSSPSRSP